MSVFRVEKNKNYTVMANYHLRDKSLSFRARGLLSTILSLPDDWDYSVNGLVTLAKDGYDSVKSALKELERNGYLVRTRARKGHGRLGSMIYTIYEEPQLAEVSPIEGYPTQVKPTEVNHGQISKDITNKKKEPKTEETNEAYVRTTRAREEAVDVLHSFIVDQIGRKLSSIERRILVRWVEQEMNPEMIRIAVQDNLFRHDRFDLRYVQATLYEWKDRGINTPTDAKNYILNRRVDKLSYVAAEIAEENYDDKLAEKIMNRSEAADLQGTRNYMIELYETGRYEALLSMADVTYHKDILEYLPQEIVDFIDSNRSNNEMV